MDKNPPQLDPKLKEAYERVMGTVVTPGGSQVGPQKTAEPAPSPSPAKEQPSPTSFNIAGSTPKAQPQPIVKTEPMKPLQVPGKKKKFSGLLLFLICAMIFFLGYAVVWVKILDLRIPLLNP